MLMRDSIFVAIIIGSIYSIFWGLDHVLVEKVRSPSQSFIAFVHVRGERHDPPYGQSVALVRSWTPFSQHLAETVSAVTAVAVH
jgi:hypothetical protein